MQVIIMLLLWEKCYSGFSEYTLNTRQSPRLHSASGGRQKKKHKIILSSDNWFSVINQDKEPEW